MVCDKTSDSCRRGSERGGGARGPLPVLSPLFLCVCVCTRVRAGAVLLDLDQKTLPGIAHQVVEQMIISDQIKAEDRANVLRALLLKHR